MPDEDTCKFGHTFKIAGRGFASDVDGGQLKDLEDVKDETGSYFLAPIMGEPQSTIQIKAGSSGTPYNMVVMGAPDAMDDEGYTVNKTEERLFISPTNQLHQSFVQRRNEAESNVRETMRNLSQLRKQKHMLEHDIRKLRSRAEAIDEKDEEMLKADFVELVDGAGGGTQQGAEMLPLKSFRDNNIYPTIVADFNEMRSVEDLKPPEESEFDNPRLNDVPKNEKAVLRKKWRMYERWKDLYGSEVQRKLKELKGELNSIERSIEETKEWLRPYVQDLTMIHQKDEEHYEDDFNKYHIYEGYASMDRNVEYIGYKPVKNTGDDLVMADEDEATHYIILYLHVVHVNLAGGSQPQDSSQGPSSAIMKIYPAFVCEHVFDSIFRAKINRQSERFKELMDDYTGEFHSEEGEKLKEARKENDLSVRELRESMEEELEEDVPIKVSSQIRRVEDGIDRPEELGAEYLEVIDEILGTELATESEEEEIYGGFEQTLRKFLGLTDEYVLPPEVDGFGEAIGGAIGFSIGFQEDNNLNTI